ncbi:MAG: GDP-mannose 4,6-dehydratase [Spirochaetales bacterium]|nr:GDP-mannose 4,6-dehydratase [Spirochaetales bacterium]
MNFLVTGNAGFIGMHVFLRLKKDKKNNVFGIDNINDYYDLQLKRDRLAEQGFGSSAGFGLCKSEKYDNCFFVKGDISDLPFLQKFFSENRIDCIIHLAAQAGVRYSFKNPASYIQSNIAGIFNLLECCRIFGIKKIIYATSSSVYGNAQKYPVCEDDDTSSPISLYAASKKAGEVIVSSYTENLPIAATGLRFFTVYGPWGRPDMAPFIFTDNISRGNEIQVFNHGKMERDYTYIDDIVNAISILSMKELPQGKNTIFNIGYGNPVRLLDFIALIEKNLGKKARMKFREMQPGDVVRTWADTAKLKDYIGWKPEYNIEYGIENYISWYKEYYEKSTET